MLFGLGTRRMGGVGTRLVFVSSIVVRTGATAATAAVARPGRPGGFRGDRRRRRTKKSPPPVGTALVDHDHVDRCGDRVDELWYDDFEVLHRVVLTKRLSVSNLADSPAADPTTPRQPDRWRSAVADAGDLPELSPPLMAAGGIWLRSTSLPAESPLCGGGWSSGDHCDQRRGTVGGPPLHLFWPSSGGGQCGGV
jgi:hypothetical protein